MRILELDVDKLLTAVNVYRITPCNYIILHLINARNIPLMKEYSLALSLLEQTDKLKKLEEDGYIKILDNDYILRGHALSIFGEEDTSVEGWIEEYRNLFPPYHKGDRLGCISKMKDFIKHNKYDKKTILRATKIYIEDKSTSNYLYLRQAHYFIMKDKTSDLAAYCERVKAGYYDNMSSNTGGNKII